MSCLEDIIGSSDDDAFGELVSMSLPDFCTACPETRNATAVGRCVIALVIEYC
jgi:hypothetical protein